jgi:ABC-type uncharacterized transport system permease subunit
MPTGRKTCQGCPVTIIDQSRAVRLRRGVRSTAATVRIAAVVPIADMPYLLVGVGLRLLQFAVFVGVWRSLAPGELPGQSTVTTLLTYSAMAQILGPLLSPMTTLTAHVANGSLAVRLLWPMGVVAQFAGEMFGALLPGAIAGAVVIAGAAVLMGVPLAPAGSVVLFALSLLLALAVSVAVDFWFGLLTVELGNGIWFVSTIRAACTSVISGALIPLYVMPWHIGDVLGWLPFAAMASGPLRVYTEESGAWMLLASQAAWAVVLWYGLARRLRRVRDKVVGYGG